MKHSRKETTCKTFAEPKLKFESQQLSGFAGLAVLQPFFAAIGLVPKLKYCFRGARAGKIYGRATIFLQLVIHLMLGFRDLRDSAHYRGDPMVKRLLGLTRLPEVSTLSRMLKETTAEQVARVQRLLRRLVLDRLHKLALARITLDFDGSVQSTRRRAEGTAVGYNKKKKGNRSYYPLFCTIAQTGQVFDFLHRSGNVHDSRGAREFMQACVDAIRAALPGVIVEIRADSAFFSDELVTLLRESKVEFTLSVPFERFVELKGMIESRKRWRKVDKERSYFEKRWRPKSWAISDRFLFIRTRVKRQRKGPVQLDLFEPHEEGYDFKVIVTNKTIGPAALLRFHEGRGAQEGIFAELKTHCAMGHVPVRRCLGNQMYLLAGLFAHNLVRELQMRAEEPSRGTTDNRAPFWTFEQVNTFRNTILRRAGRLTRPHGILTLTISAAGAIKDRIMNVMSALRPAA